MENMVTGNYGHLMYDWTQVVLQNGLQMVQVFVTGGTCLTLEDHWEMLLEAVYDSLK